MLDLRSSRVALMAMMGVFLIPVATSSLRGLTHVLACSAEASTPFSIVVNQDGPPTVLSSQVIERGDEPLICEGLRIDMGARDAGDGKVAVRFTIANSSDLPWRGTVQADLDGQKVPLDLGLIQPGGSADDELVITAGDRDREVNGTLLIGP